MKALSCLTLLLYVIAASVDHQKTLTIQSPASDSLDTASEADATTSESAHISSSESSTSNHWMETVDIMNNGDQSSESNNSNDSNESTTDNAEDNKTDSTNDNNAPLTHNSDDVYNMNEYRTTSDEYTEATKDTIHTNTQSEGISHDASDEEPDESASEHSVSSDSSSASTQTDHHVISIHSDSNDGTEHIQDTTPIDIGTDESDNSNDSTNSDSESTHVSDSDTDSTDPNDTDTVPEKDTNDNNSVVDDSGSDTDSNTNEVDPNTNNDEKETDANTDNNDTEDMKIDDTDDTASDNEHSTDDNGHEMSDNAHITDDDNAHITDDDNDASAKSISAESQEVSEPREIDIRLNAFGDNDETELNRISDGSGAKLMTIAIVSCLIVTIGVLFALWCLFNGSSQYNEYKKKSKLIAVSSADDSDDDMFEMDGSYDEECGLAVVVAHGEGNTESDMFDVMCVM